MTYDSFVTAAILDEARSLVGAYIDHIAQPSERELCITFYPGRGKVRWLFSADPRQARVHRIETKPENPAVPPNFCMLLRKWIDGARLTEVRQVSFDRVMRWEFSRSDGEHTLIAEIMGKHSNVLLVDGEETILGAIKMVPATVSRTRQILPGLKYSPPPGGRLDPLTADRPAITRALETLHSEDGRTGVEATPQAEFQGAEPASIAPTDLVRLFAGFGPFAAAEVLARARGSDPESVADAIWDLAAAVRERRFAPTLFHSSSPGTAEPVALIKPSPVGFWAFSSVQVPTDEQRPADSMSSAIDAYFSATQRTSSEDTLRRELLTAVRKERERLERLEKRLRDDLGRGENADQWKIAGELLSTQVWRVERGQTRVEVPNYYDPEQRPLAIDLDAQLTPQENVERLFRKYRKTTDAALQAMEQSEKIAAQLAEMRSWEERVAGAPFEALPALREELSRSGLLKRSDAKGAGADSRRPVSAYPPGVRIRRTMVEGWEVLLGENATSNDYLTTKVARPDDWWLHVRASPSAHVVIRTSGHPERVPPSVLHEAARITAAHSESKHSSYVPVDYVLKKFVRKPRGSAPGLVTHRGEKTLYVEPGTNTVGR